MDDGTVIVQLFYLLIVSIVFVVMGFLAVITEIKNSRDKKKEWVAWLEYVKQQDLKAITKSCPCKCKKYVSIRRKT